MVSGRSPGAKRASGRDRREAWLGVETSTTVGSAAVWKEGLIYEETFRIQGTHSERVLPAIQHALELSGIRPAEIGSLVVGSGPGSFTGVRIAAALAKGWAMARRCDLFAYSSLSAVAAGAGLQAPVCALFDARRGQVYGACYRLVPGAQEELLQPAVLGIEELLARLAGLGVSPVFAGEGALIHAGAIRAVLPEAPILPAHYAIPRAGSLLWLRKAFPELGRVREAMTWEPIYVRDWRVTTPAVGR